MDRVFEIALTNAVSATLIAVLVMCVRRYIQMPEVVRALWLVVLVRLLMPPLFELDVQWPQMPETPVVVSSGWPVAPAVPPPLEVAASKGLPLREVLAWIWLGGGLAVLALAVERIRRFRRLMASAKPGGEDLQRIVTSLSSRFGVHAPEILLVEGRVSPVLWATFGSCRLVLPSGLLRELSDTELETLCAHELAHLQRRDHWVRHLELLVQILYWWHPVAWWAVRQLRMSEEYCCDALVTRTLPGSQRAYADCLMKALHHLAHQNPTGQVLVSGFGDSMGMKGRLTMIMTPGPTQKSNRNQAFWIGLVAVSTLLVFPTLADRSELDGQALDIQVDGETLGEVLRSVALVGDLNLMIDPRVDLSAPVRFHAEEMSGEDALAHLLNQHGLYSRQEGEVLWISKWSLPWMTSQVFAGPDIGLSLEQADLRETLTAIAGHADFKIWIAPEITGTVTAELHGVPWDEAFGAIIQIMGLSYSIEDDTIRVQKRP